MKLKALILGSLFLIAAPAFAQFDAEEMESQNVMDELNPFDPNIERILDLYDAEYEAQTGEPAHIGEALDLFSNASKGCYRNSCAVYAKVVKSEQKMYLYVNGSLKGVHATSTGTRGHTTPNFDTHPNGRIYDYYTSTRYPGGNYIDDSGRKLGNMPYAVFIRGGFAIHGTGRGNWSKLGRTASHGCIRIHPDNARVFNSLVRTYGVKNTWITVQ
ncbi:MAG TPA: L,D-transpeptidase [Pseudobdellovibrionaceae bacterium]|nr:L,D-transpeptidase [Pseudobdellovibrionaceae bacterium]